MSIKKLAAKHANNFFRHGMRPGDAALQKKVIASRVRPWHLFDANRQVNGRLAGQIATMLMGKHKPLYKSHLDNGDAVVVVNCDKIVMNGNKWQTKFYRSHSGFIGGLKEVRADLMLSKHPTQILRKAVWGMLPRNRLRQERMQRLKLYAGPLHPHTAQLVQAPTNEHHSADNAASSSGGSDMVTASPAATTPTMASMAYSLLPLPTAGASPMAPPLQMASVPSQAAGTAAAAANAAAAAKAALPSASYRMHAAVTNPAPVADPRFEKAAIKFPQDVDVLFPTAKKDDEWPEDWWRIDHDMLEKEG
jgi:large subunit ribosomal protein L13